MKYIKIALLWFWHLFFPEKKSLPAPEPKKVTSEEQRTENRVAKLKNKQSKQKDKRKRRIIGVSKRQNRKKG